MAQFDSQSDEWLGELHRLQAGSSSREREGGREEGKAKKCKK